MGERTREPRRGMVIEGLVLALLIALSVPAVAPANEHTDPRGETRSHH